MTAPAQTGATAWLLAGQQLLCTGGIRAVKLHALAETAGLTTGSFYHHFRGMAEYLEALAGFYGSEQVQGTLAEFDGDAPPRARIRSMMEVARDQRHLVPLDAAMRDWAGSSELAAQAVKDLDRRLLEYLAAAFREMGCTERGAELRAQLLFSSGVARVSPPWGAQADDLDHVIDILAP